MSHNGQVRVGFNATLKHDRAGLVHWESLVAQARVKVGNPTVIVNHGLLSLACHDLVDVRAQVLIRIFRDFLSKRLKVCLGNLQGNLLHNSPVIVYCSIIITDILRLGRFTSVQKNVLIDKASHITAASLLLLSLHLTFKFYFLFCS